MTQVVPEDRAKKGVEVSTNKLTTIKVQLASMELLIGGPYRDHPYGHTALRLTTRTEERIYDYGRYARTWGVGKSEGDGVLNIWTDFDTYIADENALGRVTTGYQYDVTPAQARNIFAFYDAETAGKKPISTSRQKKSYLIEDYYALGPNCTTLSVSGAKTAIPELDRQWSRYQQGRGLSLVERGIVTAKGWPDHIFMPADLQAMLDGSTEKRPRAVKTYRSGR